MAVVLSWSQYYNILKNVTVNMIDDNPVAAIMMVAIRTPS